MTVGEAGPETVAVLRNPRQVTTDMFDGQQGGGGGQGGVGGQNIVINITGNTVRSDDDLRILAQKIEMMLNQKAALLGYRKPV